MTPAPPFDCTDCGRRIGKARTHYLTAELRVLCGRCVARRKLYDEVEWHASRAWTARKLGIWP